MLLAILLAAARVETGEVYGDLEREIPRELVAMMDGIDAPLDAVGECLDRYPRLDVDAALAARTQRSMKLHRAIREIWARSEEDALRDPPPRRRRACTMANVTAALQEADVALQRAEQAFAEATVALRAGAWFGPLQLCRASVISAGVGRGEEDGDWQLSIALRPTAAAALADITRRREGDLLAFRVAGTVVSRPRIFGLIPHGRFYLSTGDAGPLGHGATLALGPC
ncbi:hypothetical protein [Sphingomonas sp. PAMC 26617]|uniref:hypothetical protein n=1 Tax=Sphingomonas sp. PAMC 26617 TaxID=1112216 RepID=UPI00056227BE|nr:hypothetical protein [Sphingomonas sp. PAMC 26617]